MLPLLLLLHLAPAPATVPDAVTTNLPYKQAACEIPGFTRPSNDRRIFLPDQLDVHVLELSWTEARVVPKIAGIIIRDQLSLPYQVHGVLVSGTPDAYAALQNEQADFGVVLWPNNYESSARRLALERECPRSPSGFCLTAVGSTGYRARSGWYIPKASLADEGLALELANILALYKPATQAKFLTAETLRNWTIEAGGPRCSLDPSEFNFQGLASERTSMRGEYDIEDCSWALKREYAVCCPRQGFPDGGGCDGLPPCLALVVDTPRFDIGVNEDMVAELAANQSTATLRPPGVQIVYADVATVVNMSERRQQPMLTYSWEPRTSLMTAGRFVRMNMRNFYCARRRTHPTLATRPRPPQTCRTHPALATRPRPPPTCTEWHESPLLSSPPEHRWPRLPLPSCPHDA